MPEHSGHKLIDRSSFPAKIQMPDIGGYTGEVFNIKVNANWKEAEAGSYAWFDSYSIFTDRKRQEFFDTGFGLMAALILADADLEHLRPSMDYMLWLFAFDDISDVDGLQDVNRAKLVVGAIMDVLRNPDTAQPELRVVAALHNFFNRMRANSSPATIKRFVDAADLFTQAVLEQTVNRSTHYVPTVEEYIKVRQDTSSTKMFYCRFFFEPQKHSDICVTAVLEYSLGLDLPDEVHNDPIITELLVAGNDIVNWANDVYSFPVEYARGDTHNLVYVAMWNHQLDLEGAIDYVDKLTRKRLQEYVDAKAQLRSFGPKVDPQVALYIQGFEYSFQGFIEWQFMTPRYFGADAQKVRDTGIVDLTALNAPGASTPAEI
ncbi:hypothetical protein FRC10_004559 [Ceratobasidium sp. 414]|nr:hypothetical protein FRC10_004559 [Ceratobasidium sp. 414]